MGINASDFRTHIVEPTCKLCAELASVPDTPYSRDLLVATAAIETHLGTWLHQVRGPAVSVYQFEPTTLHDLLTRFASRPRFASLLKVSTVEGQPAVGQIIWNLRLATVCARLNYYRVPEALPEATTFDTLWHYYKRWWNTSAGAATPAAFRTALRLTDIHV